MATLLTVKGDTLVLPRELRERYGLQDGSVLVVEVGDEGFSLRPDWPEPETYSPERKAEFLLTNAMDAEEYEWAIAEVRRMGVDPENVPHYRPAT